MDSGGRCIGIFALQVAIGGISAIISGFTGDLNTLDVYLAGQDFKARPPCRLEDGHALLKDLPPLPHIQVAYAAAPVLSGEDASRAAGTFYPSKARTNGGEIAAASIPAAFRNLQWVLVAELDRAEILTPAVTQRRIMILISLTCAAVISIAGWLFARPATRQTHRLCAEMEAVSAGNLETDVQAVHRSYEISKIGKTLVLMQSDLKRPVVPRSITKHCSWNRRQRLWMG
ncbi:hypothetical protein METH_14540 [Leisingera methylohalidivorans DSM 14336]|uniref:HAMP domain-containing protein n=2 Tax=Leisingera methylohalidivorans TaxID=133924 RepID=V9VZC9_9RHOB|nr:hypothetical protein METH_14540 [Leisingera methylohalidivorans DSM 14336]